MLSSLIATAMFACTEISANYDSQSGSYFGVSPPVWKCFSNNEQKALAGSLVLPIRAKPGLAFENQANHM